MSALSIERDVPLSRHTTLELGGAAEYFAQIETRPQLIEALTWARTQGVAVNVLGGGSNVVVSDRGLRGLVLKLATQGVAFSDAGEVRAETGENWDELVASCVARELAGIECLSGIPGCVGAAPVQNIGAYGVELQDRFDSLDAIDLDTGRSFSLDAAQCAFGYRDSVFKHVGGGENDFGLAGRALITRVRFRLPAFLSSLPTD